MVVWRCHDEKDKLLEPRFIRMDSEDYKLNSKLENALYYVLPTADATKGTSRMICFSS